jgi:hypothetical protein
MLLFAIFLNSGKYEIVQTFVKEKAATLFVTLFTYSLFQPRFFAKKKKRHHILLPPSDNIKEDQITIT